MPSSILAMDFSRNTNKSNMEDSDSTLHDDPRRNVNKSNRADAESVHTNGYSGGDATSQSNIEIGYRDEKVEKSHTTILEMHKNPEKTRTNKRGRGNCTTVQ